jgi:hypothetical protein
MMPSLSTQDGIDVAHLRHHEGEQFEVYVDVHARFVAGFDACVRNRCDKRAGNEFPGTLEIGNRLLQHGLVGWFQRRRTRNFQTPFHHETITARAQDGNPISRRPAVLPSPGCDISAEAFVAKQSQRADAICNEEAWFSRLRFDAPKLCLGETHVPQKIF